MSNGENKGKGAGFGQDFSGEGIDWEKERPRRILEGRKLLQSCDAQHRLDVFWVETARRFRETVVDFPRVLEELFGKIIGVEVYCPCFEVELGYHTLPTISEPPCPRDYEVPWSFSPDRLVFYSLYELYFEYGVRVRFRRAWVLRGRDPEDNFNEKSIVIDWADVDIEEGGPD
jgi:hypothetical protein